MDVKYREILENLIHRSKCLRMDFRAGTITKEEMTFRCREIDRTMQMIVMMRNAEILSGVENVG